MVIGLAIIGLIALTIIAVSTLVALRGLNFNRGAYSHREHRASIASAEHLDWRVGQVDSHWAAIRRKPDKKAKKIEGKADPEGADLISVLIRKHRKRIRDKAALYQSLHAKEASRIAKGRTGQKVHPAQGHTTHGVRRAGHGSEGLLSKFRLHHSAYPKPPEPKSSKPSAIHKIVVGKTKKE